VQEAFKDSIGTMEVGYSNFRNDEDLEKDFTLDNYMRSHNPKLHKISYYEFCMDPIDAFRYPYYDYNMNEPYAVLFKAINKDQAERLAIGVWEYVKEHKFTIPLTSVNVNPLYEDSEQEEEPLEFVNIMQLVKYSEVVQECDSLA
jgi:hypothetical protein